MRPAPIAERVDEIRNEGGDVVCSADFIDLTSAKNASTQLARLASEGLVRRIMRGIYWIAPVRDTGASGSNSPATAGADRRSQPSLDSIAEAIARSNRWTIVPSGASALAELGLADGVSDEMTFASTGPYASYEMENGSIVFRHVADRYIAGLSETTRLIVQVLRAEGRAFATPENAGRLASELTQLEADQLVEESAQLPEWMRSFANDVREARIARGKARIKELIALDRDQAKLQRDLARQVKELTDLLRTNPNPAKAVAEALEAWSRMPNPTQLALQNTALMSTALDSLRTIPDPAKAVMVTTEALDQLGSQISAVDKIRDSWDSFLGNCDRHNTGEVISIVASPTSDATIELAEGVDVSDGPFGSSEVPTEPDPAEESESADG